MKVKIVFFSLVFLTIFLFGCNQAPKVVCGDGKIQAPEHCEGADFQDFSCEDFGFSGGNLSCDDNCKLNVSTCNRTSFLEGRQQANPEQEPLELFCTSPTGIEGKKGTYFEPKIEYDWNWSRNNKCFQKFGEKQSSTEWPFEFYFCDSTQFTIYLFYQLDQMAAGNESSRVFFAGLMSDGISEDFRKDFVKYYTEVAFFETPTDFLETIQEVLVDEEKLVFEPENIEEPGIYEVTITRGEDKWIVERKLFLRPENQSNFYYFPIDGLLGFNLREGEEFPDRVGYGTGFSGDSLIFDEYVNGDVIIDKPINSTRKNVAVKKNTSFFEANLNKRGYQIELDLQKGELNIFNSSPNLVMVDFSQLDNQASENGAPFFIANSSTGETIVPQNNYTTWHFLYSKNQCTENEQTTDMVIFDNKNETSSCGIGESQQMARLSIGEQLGLTLKENETFSEGFVKFTNYSVTGPNGESYSADFELFKNEEMIASQTLLVGGITDFDGKLSQAIKLESLKATGPYSEKLQAVIQFGVEEIYPNSLEQFKNSSAVLGTIFYVPQNQELAIFGACNSEFISTNSTLLHYKPQEILPLNLTQILISDLDFTKVFFGTNCIYEDIENKKTIVFSNEEKLFEKFPICTDCQCINSNDSFKIMKIGSKPSAVYAGSSFSVWAQFKEQAYVSQPDIELFLIHLDGKESKQNVIFFDDGKSNDFKAIDNIFGTTIVEGLNEPGVYEYYIKAKDHLGNEAISEKQELEVLQRPNCDIIHFGGKLEKQMNIFIVGDNWKGEKELDYFESAQKVKNAFFKAAPTKDYDNGFNFIAIDKHDGMGCYGVDLKSPLEDSSKPLIFCDRQRLVSAAVSCKLPFKNRAKPNGDKIVLLHKGNFRSNAVDLRGQIARVSEDSEDVDQEFPKIALRAVHELGHTFGLLDLYPTRLMDALNIKSCEESDKTNCVMCDERLVENGYICHTTFRYQCNLSFNLNIVDRISLWAPSFGTCPDDQREMDDYEYIVDFFSKLEERK